MFGKILEQSLKGVKHFFSAERVVVFGVFLLLIWLLIQYANGKTTIVDKMEDGNTEDGKKEALHTNVAESAKNAQNESGKAASGSGYTTHQVANPADLLPTDTNSQWSALNPNAAKKGETMMPDLLKAGHHIGTDTIGQTLRNANLQLRSDPIITKAVVGPWNQSTIETDYARVPLELGPHK